LRGIFDLMNRRKIIAELEKETVQKEFWNDGERAQQVLKQIRNEKVWIDDWEAIQKSHTYLQELLEITQAEQDESILEEIEKNIGELKQAVADLELKKMLGGEDDSRDTIMTIHPGAGGTESQDWASMLMRMYVRWCEKKKFKVTVMDLQAGDEAGIKSATLEVKGEFAFGLLKSESGVHRLVRLSPFDSNHRRHTSFTSIFVYPEIDETISVEINPQEMRIDTYRASGAGGQHVNKTDSAVRITHIPTGIVVQCQNERSQHKNKANALKILRARLYQLYKEEEEKRKEKIEEAKKDIAWGSQIRSYILHPYNLVKDHRTKIETSDVQKVLEGELDSFIEGYLLSSEVSDRK